MKHRIILGLLIVGTSAIAAEGPISGGGGGPVIYQAVAVAQIMSDISNDMNIAQKYFPISGARLKSIDFLSAQRDADFPYGRSIYLVRNSGDCAARVETIAKDESGMTYSSVWHELVCPGAGGPCTGWGGDISLPHCGGR